ncbi:MAG: class I SAM-dependent rRNA methyltransferase [Bacteriovoracaceae bacterium]|nr:class I SAM-dependent rRNA methyltransferase [Bacteriovoracaceae bacterium]
MKTLLVSNKKLKKPLIAYDVLGEKELGKVNTGFQPGEWILADDETGGDKLLGYINPFAKNHELFRAIQSVNSNLTNEIEENVARKIIIELLENAILKRDEFNLMSEGCRLVFGRSDSLPGLVIDKCNNHILIQMNTMGIHRYRNVIMDFFTKSYPDYKTVFLGNRNLGIGEELPLEEMQLDDEWISATENGISYSIRNEKLQKTGFYFDHRDNRNRLVELLNRKKTKYKKGLDLFCYLGAWGSNLLKNGVETCQFVDQADFSSEFEKNMKENGFIDRYEFHRSDVFKFLDENIKNNKKFDVIISDPPAFIKNPKDKNKAIVGYEKLHHKCLNLIDKNGVFVAASCTQPVSIEDFDKTVAKAAIKSNVKLELIDIGMQSVDHPTNSLTSKTNYIKYLAYKVT